MAAIDISSAGGGSVSTGVLQLQNGVAMDSTLRNVADQSNTTSPLKLSTSGVQVASTLQITTNSEPYIDAEDGAGNNRFTVGRSPSSQVVYVDFASNPTGGTNQVGAIRTYTDGVNLAEVMSFRKDGAVGINTTSPTQSLEVSSNAALTTLLISSKIGAGTGNSKARLFFSQSDSYTSYIEQGIGSLNIVTHAGTSPVNITGTLAVGSISGAKVGIKGDGSTSATTSLLVQNVSGTAAMRVKDDLSTTFGGTIVGTNAVMTANVEFQNILYGTSFFSQPTGATTLGAQAAADASAMLDIRSTTRGVLFPRMTNAQRAAIASPAQGLMLYNTTNNGVAYNDGTNWGYLSAALQNLTGSGGTLAIGFGAGNVVNLTLNASTTLTFSGHVIGTYIIQVTQGGAGSNTLTYPASVKWSGGTAPTLTTTVGKTDILTFYHDGTNFYGTYSLNY